MIAPHVCFMLFFPFFPFFFTCSLNLVLAASFTDYYLSTHVTRFIPCLNLFVIHSSHSYISQISFAHCFQLLILFTPIIHVAYFLGISGTGHSPLMSIFALCFHVHSSWHQCMPTPPPLIECLISSFIHNSVFLCFFPP